MKILKWILIVIVVIVVVAAVAGMFMPSHVHMEKTAMLKSPQEAVFKQVDDLKNWNNWMPWNKMDPNMKITYGDKSEGLGANYTWESSNGQVGIGKATITESVPTQKVSTNLDFGKNGSGTSTLMMDKQEAGTNVTWSFDCEMGSNPFKRLMGATVMKTMMMPMFEKGLMSLDSAAMTAPQPMPIQVSAQDSSATAQVH